MHELLEHLPTAFDKAFKKEVSLKELTILSLHCAEKYAVVLTNHYFYIIIKGFFRSRCEKIPLQEVKDVVVEEGKMTVFSQARNYAVKFHQKKAYLAKDVRKKLLEKAGLD